MNVWDVAEDDDRRSRYIRDLVRAALPRRSSRATPVVPAKVVGFWHDPAGPPDDVRECLASWRQSVDDEDLDLLVFNDVSARTFVERHYGPCGKTAFDLCPHPAMRSDLFRLCFLLECGGVYVDADDLRIDRLPAGLINSDQVHLQPLCYDSATARMADRSVFTGGDTRRSLIFYVNNAPLIAPPGHPLIQLALERAISLLFMGPGASGRWDIQSTTGPGNLSAALVAYCLESVGSGRSLDVDFLDWDAVAVSRWPLGYREDARNWRNWDGIGRIGAASTPGELDL